MAERRFALLTIILSRGLDRRGALLTLTAGVSGVVAGYVPISGLARRGRRKKERKRLRKQCKKLCKQVQRDCLFVCRNLVNPDDVCHPRCATARRGCRRGC